MSTAHVPSHNPCQNKFESCFGCETYLKSARILPYIDLSSQQADDFWTRFGLVESHASYGLSFMILFIAMNSGWDKLFRMAVHDSAWTP